jgi:hypothetical protein
MNTAFPSPGGPSELPRVPADPVCPACECTLPPGETGLCLECADVAEQAELEAVALRRLQAALATDDNEALRDAAAGLLRVMGVDL